MSWGSSRRSTPPSPPDVLLDVQAVDAGYGAVQVLFGASLQVLNRERVAVLGTNGAGKTTLLRAVSGLLPPTSGRVWFKGEDVTGADPVRLVEMGMAYIAGGNATFPALTVAENLRMSAYPIRRDRAQVTARLEEAYELFPRLRDRMDQKAGTLSGGEQQMVAVGRAFVAHPELLIIDELSLGLAPIVLQVIQEMIGTLAERGITMLIVEQSMNVAAAVAGRAYFMEKGEVRFEARLDDLATREDLVRSVFAGGTTAAKRPGRRTAKRARPSKLERGERK